MLKLAGPQCFGNRTGDTQDKFRFADVLDGHLLGHMGKAAGLRKVAAAQVRI